MKTDRSKKEMNWKWTGNKTSKICSKISNLLPKSSRRRYLCSPCSALSSAVVLSSARSVLLLTRRCYSSLLALFSCCWYCPKLKIFFFVFIFFPLRVRDILCAAKVGLCWLFALTVAVPRCLAPSSGQKNKIKKTCKRRVKTDLY